MPPTVIVEPRVITDPADNVVLNFLKWARLCTQSRCWVLDSLFPAIPGAVPPTAMPVTTFELAWNQLTEPFWMLAALDAANDPTAIPPALTGVDGAGNARDLAVAAVAKVIGLLSDDAKKAFSVLQMYVSSRKTGAAPPGPVPLAGARLAAGREAAAYGGTDLVSDKARAASALVAAFACADGDNIDAADVAWALATEALHWNAGPPARVNWMQYWTDRQNLAKLTVRPLFNPTTGPGKAVCDNLTKKHANPPPWARNTNHTRPWPSAGAAAPPTAPTPGHLIPYAIVAPGAATPPGKWISTTSKSGYPVWQAFGTDDDGTPQSRSASVSPAGPAGSVSGTYISPPSGPPNYQWGFQFTNLPIGQTVTLVVQWVYPSPLPTVSQSLNAVVATS
jgi:hypothetical protein